MSAQLREAVLQVTQANIPLNITGRELDDAGVWEILLYASVNQLTIESSCQELAEAPSGNTVREHLAAALNDQRASLVAREEQLTRALQTQLPRRFRRRLTQRRWELAIDLHDIPYHGQPALSESEVRRGPAKAGTTHFHSYATIAIVHDQRRYELAVTFVWADETMGQVVERLIALIRRLNLRVKRLYLDKGFCSQAVFSLLRRHRLPYIIPIPLRGKKDERGVYQGGIGRLFIGRGSYYTRYTFNANLPDAYTTDVAMVRTYSRGRYGRHRATWFAYAVYGVDPIPPHQISAHVASEVQRCLSFRNRVSSRAMSSCFIAHGEDLA
jgi:putative transposase